MGDSRQTTPPLTEPANGTPAGPPRDSAKAQLARDRGWVEQQNFDYEATVPPQEEAAQGWMSRARKYEWKDEYGNVGPEDPDLEQELFRSELKLKKGVEFDKYVFTATYPCAPLTDSRLLSIRVVAEAIERPSPVRDFDDAGLHPVMLSNIKKSGYDVPTPVQAYTIPAVLKGHDVIAVAQTGRRTHRPLWLFAD